MPKQKLKKISKQLKGASKLHAGQAKKIDSMVSGMPMKKNSPKKFIKVQGLAMGKYTPAVSQVLNARRINNPNAKVIGIASLPMMAGKSSALKKISAACKSAAKRKFKVWPSAYASGWGVRCTRSGGPSKFGGGKKKK